jgi:hypothetical protein
MLLLAESHNNPPRRLKIHWADSLRALQARGLCAEVPSKAPATVMISLRVATYRVYDHSTTVCGGLWLYFIGVSLITALCSPNEAYVNFRLDSINVSPGMIDLPQLLVPDSLGLVGVVSVDTRVSDGVDS